MEERRRVIRWQRGVNAKRLDDALASEEPLEIQVESRPVTVTMRTPGHDDELAAGFLLTEGLISQARDVRAIRPYPRNRQGNSLNVFLAPGIQVDWARLTRHVFASSSCGLCGKASIRAVQNCFPPIRQRFQVEAALLEKLPLQMRERQTVFSTTGGLHAAALFTAEGNLVVLREDVGRHNAVDKVIGHALLRDVPAPQRQVLLVSGRASFEIVQKALAARIAIVASVSAPSSLAVDFARANGQTLVGFLREGRFNVYAGPRRVRLK